MSQRELAHLISDALTKPVRDVTRYDGTRARLAELLGSKPEEISVKVVGDVTADFKNRIGEVVGRRNTKFIAVLLTCDHRPLREEVEKATEQTRQISATTRFTGAALFFGEDAKEGWTLQRVVEAEPSSVAIDRLVASLSLSADVVLRLWTQSSQTSPKRKDAIAEADAIIYAAGTGIEEEEIGSEETITEPFDPTKIRVESKSMTIDLLLTRIKHGELDLTPGFQRKGGIWNDAAQSRLVESVLIRIPLPAFYMDATDDNRWLVVDGLQRLTTLKRFVLDDELRLDGLEFLSTLKGRAYSDLPRNFQRRIEETQVTVYLIEKGTPAEVKFNIFKRINTGGLPLSSQEIRHALNQGRVTSFLQELSTSKEFLLATDGSIHDKRMADRECVLRFLAFSLSSYQEYRAKDFDGFLNDKMADLNRMDEGQLAGLSQGFKRAMSAARAIFGRDAFRKRYQPKAPRYPISKALFEAWSVNLSRLSDSELELVTARADKLKDAFMDLMRSRSDFDSAISQGTGDPGKVRLRFGQIGRIIGEVLA